MRMPILLLPKYFALRNRWRAEEKRSALIFRDILIVFVGLFVMWGIFFLSIRGLRKISENAAFAYLSPSIPIGIVLMMLFVMLLVSSLITSLGIFFTAHDLELHLSSPISRTAFFFQKFFHVLVTSAWMPLIFLFPLLAAYGYMWQVHSSFYFLSMLLLIPYFVIPAAIATVASTIFSGFFPVGRTRELLILAVLMLLAFIYLFVELVSFGSANHNDMGQLLRMLSLLSLPDSFWLPSHWVAGALRDSLEGRFEWNQPQIRILFSSAVALLAFAYLLLIPLHQRGYSRAQNNRRGLKTRLLEIREALVERIRIPIGPKFAVAFKDYASFARETTQTIQLLLLAGIFIIYLYNLRIFRVLDQLPAAEADFWRTFLYIANNGMGALITTAVCTRFVFPSISLEGQSFWILRKGPLHIRDLVQTKFLTWYFPVGAISGLVFAAGAIALGGSLSTVLLNFGSGWIMSLGLVGLATGFGAIFVNFKWEHPSQLSASFGSLTFMLVATLVIGLSLLPIGLIVYSVASTSMLSSGSPLIFYLGNGLSILGVFLINWFVMRLSIDQGVRSLERQSA